MSQFIEMFKDSHKVGLGQLATFINGSAFKPEDWSTEGLPIVRIQNLNDTSCEYNFYNGDCSKKIVIDNGDVLVSWSATLGVFIWDKGKALLNQHIFKVVFDKIEIDRDFFIYTVSVALDKMSQHTHGSTMKHIVKSEFNKFPVACPTLSEQKEFAQIAQQADKSEFDGLKSQFIEMRCHTTTTRKKVGEVAKVMTGSTPSRNHPEYWGGSNYWVADQDMGGIYVTDTLEKVTDEGYATCKVVPAGSVLYVCRGSIGVISINTMDCATNQSICTATCNDGYINEYLYYSLKFAEGDIKKQGTGTSFKSLNQSSFAAIELDFPSIDDQKAFVEIARQADKSEFDGLKSQFIEMFGRTENTKPLSDFIEVSFPGEWGQEDKDGNGVKVIRTTNFTNTGKLNLADVVTRDIDPNKVEKKKLKKGDIILERSGGTNDNPVGRVVYFNEDGLYLFNNFTQLLRCKEEVNSLFIFYSLFNYYQMNKRIIRSMGNKTTGIQNLKMDQYWQIPIADVPVERQNEFEAIYRQADKSESAQELLRNINYN